MGTMDRRSSTCRFRRPRKVNKSGRERKSRFAIRTDYEAFRPSTGRSKEGVMMCLATHPVATLRTTREGDGSEHSLLKVFSSSTVGRDRTIQTQCTILY